MVFSPRATLAAASKNGIVLAVASAVLLSLYGIWYKSFADQVNTAFMLVSRGGVQYAIFTLLALVRGRALAPDTSACANRKERARVWLHLVSVNVSGALRMMAIFLAMLFVASSVTMTILSGAPVLILVVGRLFFPEDKITFKKLGCVALLLVGVAMNCQFDEFTARGVSGYKCMLCGRQRHPIWHAS